MVTYGFFSFYSNLGFACRNIVFFILYFIDLLYFSFAASVHVSIKLFIAFSTTIKIILECIVIAFCGRTRKDGDAFHLDHSKYKGEKSMIERDFIYNDH